MVTLRDFLRKQERNKYHHQIMITDMWKSEVFSY